MSGCELSELPDEAPQLRPHVSDLRRRALQELPAAGTLSDGFLIKFLRARDFDPEPCLKLLLNYQRWRRESPTISSCLSPSSVLGLLTSSYHAVLPQRDHAGSRILVYRIGQWNPKDWSAFEVFRVSLMTSELLSMETQTQRRGLKVIFDLQGWSLGHALQMNPALARKISSVLSDSFPLKVRGIHLLNEPMFFRPVFTMIRPFLPDKIKQRIHMHGGDFHDTLSDFFSADVLPPEYGGEAPGIEEACRDWTNQLLRSETLLQQIAAHPTGDIAADIAVHPTGDIAADIAVHPTGDIDIAVHPTADITVDIIAVHPTGDMATDIAAHPTGDIDIAVHPTGDITATITTHPTADIDVTVHPTGDITGDITADITADIAVHPTGDMATDIAAHPTATITAHPTADIDTADITATPETCPLTTETGRECIADG